MPPYQKSGYYFWKHSFGLVLLLVFYLAPSHLRAEQAAAPLNVESELLLDVRLDGSSLSFAILGYQEKGQFWLSLSELMEVLQFPVNVDVAVGRAGGWYVQEERSFSLDLTTGVVTSNEDVFRIDGRAQVFQSDIFVTTEALAQWFPVVLTPNIRQLQLLVETTETIPLQDRLSRFSNRSFGSAAGRREPILPFQETPYRALGPHATDIRLNMSSVLEDEDDTSTSFGGNYSILSRGDLAWMTSTIAISGSKNDELSDGRFKLERSDLDAPLRLEHVEVGDVDAGSRGLLVRGGGAQEGLTGLFADEQVDLRGDVPPGWEVELYRNGVLVDFQVVSGKAQYEFLDVPLEFGENRFEFVLYGPFGEERREEQVYYAGRSELELGEVSYELAAVQDGRSVFDVRPETPKGDIDTARFLGDFNIGLAPNAIASFGVDSFVVNDQREQDYRAGVSVNFAKVQTSAGYQNRALALDEATGLVRARLGRSTTTSVRYTHYLKGDLDNTLVPINRSLWAGDLGLSTRIAALPLNFEGRHIERETTRTSSASVGTTVMSKGGVRLSKSFYYSRDSQAGVAEERTGGTLNVSTSMRPWRFRAGMGYGISPQTDINNVNASASVQVDSQMTMNFDVNHSAQTDYTAYRAGFNWLLDYVQVSPQVIYDSNERWVGLVSLSTSFNPRPGRAWPHIDRMSQANSGAAYALAFMDNNGNGVRDEGEVGLDDVRVDAVQDWRSGYTEADGRGYLTRLRRDRVTDIAVDPSSLPGIDMWPVNEGVSIKPRPGSWSRVDYPVIRTMELEGHVLTQASKQSDTLRPVERAQVQLVDSDGVVVASQRTAFDGFFLFATVPPGIYKLQLGEQWQSRIEERPGKIGVSAEGDVIQDLNFVLAAPQGRQLVGAGTANAATETIASPSFAPVSAALASSPKTKPEANREPEVSLPELPAKPLASGNWFVQLGAFSKRTNAQKYWEELLANRVMPAMYESRLDKTGTLFRLLAAPGQSEDEARSLCDQVKVKGKDCLVREIDEP